MIAKVIGFERIDFSNQQTGQSIKGTRLYINFENPSIKGVGCDTKFFSDDNEVKLPEIVLGRSYDFVYQVKGFGGKPILTAVNPVRN